MIPLTVAQGNVLEFIRTFSAEHGHAPTMTEIADGTGRKSKSGIYYIVEALEERGAIRRLHNRARAIEIIVHPSSALDFLTPDLRREIDKIAAREGVAPHVTVSEIVRGYLGMGA